jgi:hypothetical protein
MREILFRGKAIADNKWRYGGIHINDEGRTFIIIGSYPDKKIGYCFCEVDPNTVGQYMGIKDKLNKRLFEGEKVKCILSMDEKTGDCESTTAIVCYDSEDAGFYFDTDCEKFPYAKPWFVEDV